jgi:microcystin-dependent protein
MDAYMGMIMPWAPNFAPTGWMFCDGRTLAISQYQALFALIGTYYGGDGVNTFALPDLRSRMPVGVNNGGTSTGLTSYTLGQKGGAEANTLSAAQMPVHSHANTVAVSSSTVTVSVAIPAVQATAGDTAKPGPTVVLGKVVGELTYSSATPDTNMEPFNSTGSVTPSVTINNANAGGSAPVDNRQPFLALNYIICYQGIFPSRN